MAQAERDGAEAQVKAALTTLSRNIGKLVDGPHATAALVDGPHATAALARCNEIRSIVVDGVYCPTSMTGHPSGCRCR